MEPNADQLPCVRREQSLHRRVGVAGVGYYARPFMICPSVAIKCSDWVLSPFKTGIQDLTYIYV